MPMKNTAEKIKTVVDLTKVLVPDVVVHVPLDQLAPDPGQPRTEFPEATLKQLADDIERRGVEQPIRVRSDGERYLIKHGERRWRAAQLAGLKTVPVLLAGPDDDAQPDLERAFDQVLDNHLPEKLSPMDWARFLRKLVDVHHLPVKDIPAELAKRGITLSRPYVSNLMRLVDLPDWAQKLLNDQQITASDAKAILMAKPYAKAMKWLKDHIEHEPRQEGQRVRDALFQYDYDDMEALVDQAYDQTAIELSATYGGQAPLFKWATSCKACPDRQQIGVTHYCLNATCFDAKQDKARIELKSKGKSEEKALKENRGKDTKPKPPAGPTKIAPGKIVDGVVKLTGLASDKYEFLDSYRLRFEPSVHCTGCEFNKPAIHSKGAAPRACCFNLPHFNELQRQGSREEGVAQWLDKRVLPEVLAKLPGDHELQFQIVAWMALEAPVQNDNGARLREELRRQQHAARQRLNLFTPAGVIQTYAQGALNVEAIAAGGVRAMLADRGNFYAFARHLGIAITPAIASLDQEYVDLKRKGELLLLMGMADDVEFKKKKLDELIEHCLLPEVIEAVGVPPDVQALYERLQPVVDPDDEDVTDDLEIDEDGESEPDPLDTEMTYLDEVDTGEDTNVEPMS
jgi:ParB/RepB/Spo0J family partition protein